MAKVYGPATPRGMQRIVDVVRHVERSPGYSLNPGPRNSGSSSELWLPFENNTGSTVPGNSLLRVTGLTLSEGVPILAIAKASTTFGREWAVTANRDVPSGEFGVATLANLPVRLAYDSTQSPAAGETYGPKPDSFVSWENYPGFICLGIVDSTNHIMLATREEPPFYLCKADSSISKGSTGTASLYVGASGSETDSTVNITSCRALWGAIATSKWCGVSFVNGVPYITQLEC